MEFIRRNVNKEGTSASTSSIVGAGVGFDMSQWFYKDEEGNIHAPVNFIGDLNVSAYGAGEAAGGTAGSSVSVVDSLTSESTTSALSANQGRVLKSLIDSKGTAFENASVLSGITSTKVSNWDSAATNSHTHSNKTQLDKVTSTKITNWDTAYGWGNHASAGYLTSHLDISGKENTSNKVSSWSTTTNNTRYPSEKLVKDSLDGKISTTHAANNVTSAKITNWDNASTNSHTHSNKTVLDGITSTNVTNWGTAYTNNHTHSNKSVLDSLTLELINMLVNLCKYVSFDASGNVTFTGNIISNKNVTAYE